MFAKSCERHSYGPAAVACKALMEQGSVEFPGSNAKCVLACLSPEMRFGHEVSVARSMFTLSVGTPDRGNVVKLEVAEDQSGGGMFMRMLVEGY
jgi:hypothetical protein